MKKILSLVVVSAALVFAGCGIAQKNTAQQPATNTGISITQTNISSQPHFVYDEQNDNLSAMLPDQKLEVLFDYNDYKNTCGSDTGTTVCASTGVMDVQHFEQEPIVISGNKLFNTFEIGTKEASTDITKIISQRFNFSLARCPLSFMKSEQRGRLLEDDTVIYTVNYERFRNEENAIDPNAIGKICGGFVGYEVYYSPASPERYIIEQASYEKRGDALFDFLYLKYTK